MQLTKGAIGNLINRYKAVLKKCHLMNTFGSLAVAGMLVMGSAGVAVSSSDPIQYKATSGSKIVSTNINYAGNAETVILAQGYDPHNEKDSRSDYLYW